MHRTSRDSVVLGDGRIFFSASCFASKDTVAPGLWQWGPCSNQAVLSTHRRIGPCSLLRLLLSARADPRFVRDFRVASWYLGLHLARLGDLSENQAHCDKCPCCPKARKLSDPAVGCTSFVRLLA